MRSISRSETTCSSCSASSCTSAQLMPITCTRNGSTRRWRRSTRPASLLAGLRQPHAGVRLVFGQPRLRQRLHHRRRRARRDADRRGDVPHRQQPLSRAAASTDPGRSPSGSFRPCSTGACRDIIRRNVMTRWPTRSPRRTASAATCARCFRRSPIVTISLPCVLSYGQDQRWKRRLVDLAGGAARAGPADARSIWRPAPATSRSGCAAAGWDVVGLDVTRRMIELARAKAAARAGDRRAPRFLVGDMLALPFPNASFDVVTAGYGLRNVPDLRAAIDEIHRVLKRRRAGRCRSTSTGRRIRSCARVYLAYLQMTGRPARLGSAPRPRHVPLHPGVDSQLSRRRRRRAAVRGARVRPRGMHEPSSAA